MNKNSEEDDVYLIGPSMQREPNKIIADMLHGVDISLVHPSLYPSILPFLYNYLDKLDEENDYRIIEKINFYIEYIKKQPRRDEIKELLAKPPPPPVVHTPALTEDQVKSEIDTIFKTKDIHPYKNQEELQLVVAGLRKLRAEYISQSNYIKAQEADHYATILISHEQLGTVEKFQNAKAEEVAKKLSEAKENLIISKKKWEGLYKNFMKAVEKDMNELFQQHTNEIRELNDLRETEIPPHIAKYSNLLLDLEARQNFLIRNRRYLDADTIGLQIDELRKKEDEENQQKWIKEIDHRILNKQKNHERILETRKQYWKNSRFELVNQANKEIEQGKKSIEHLEKHLNDIRKAEKMAADLKKESKSIPNQIESQKQPQKVAKTTPPSNEATPRFHFYTSVGTNKNSSRGQSQLQQLDPNQEEQENQENDTKELKSKSSLANAPKLKIKQTKSRNTPPPYLMPNTGLATMLSANKMKALDKARSNFRQRQILNYQIYTKTKLRNPSPPQGKEKKKTTQENQEEDEQL